MDSIVSILVSPGYETGVTHDSADNAISSCTLVLFQAYDSAITPHHDPCLTRAKLCCTTVRQKEMQHEYGSPLPWKFGIDALANSCKLWGNSADRIAESGGSKRQQHVLRWQSMFQLLSSL